MHTKVNQEDFHATHGNTLVFTEHLTFIACHRWYPLLWSAKGILADELSSVGGAGSETIERCIFLVGLMQNGCSLLNYHLSLVKTAPLR